MSRMIRTHVLGLMPSIAAIASTAHADATLRFAIAQDEGSLTPYTYQTGYPGYELMTLIYDTSHLLDENLGPQPWLASGLVIDDDGVTYHLTIREGARWRDGSP